MATFRSGTMYGDGTTITSVGILRKSATTNQACCAMIVDKDVCNARFLLYSLKYHKDAFIHLALGGAQRNLNGKTIKEFCIDLPCLEVQDRIVSILSAYDNLIENNTRRIAILEEMAQRIYTEWFVHFRFPGHEKAKMVDSEVGRIPSGWDVKKLSRVASVNKHSIKKGKVPDAIKYIDIKAVSPGRINEIKPMSFSKAPSRARRKVKSEDIIWSTVRPNRRSYALILDPEPDTIVSTGFAVITAKSVPYSFLYSQLTTDGYVDYLTNHATGAAYPAVNQNDFKNSDILVPDEETLNKFHQIIGSVFLQAHVLLKKNTLLRQTRDLLLPRLISGEIDVFELQEAAAAA